MHIAAASGCGAESLDVLDALYWLDAAAQNEYNPEFSELCSTSWLTSEGGYYACISISAPKNPKAPANAA